MSTAIVLNLTKLISEWGQKAQNMSKQENGF